MISTRSLTKDFVVSRTETVHAVRGISLDVEPGELVAVLGPNGAGKTTTMRMLTTLIAPDRRARRRSPGHDVVTESAQVRRLIGYVGQGNGAGHTQRVGDELYSQGVIYGLDRRSAQAPGRRAAGGARPDRAGRRKVSEPVRRPAPAAGRRDGAGARAVAAVPGRAVDRPRPAEPGEPVGAHPADAGASTTMTIVLTTHYLDEADSMAERVVVVDHGEVIADDTAEALKAELAGDRIVVDRRRPAATRRRWPTLVGEAARCPRRDRRRRRRSARGSPTARAALPELMRGRPAGRRSGRAPRRCTGRPSTTSSSPSPAAACARPSPTPGTDRRTTQARKDAA